MDSFNFDFDFLNEINFTSQNYISNTETEKSFIKKDEVPVIKNEYQHNSFDLKELTSKLNGHNEMVKEINKLRGENEKLKKQLISMNESAKNVRIMYQNEHKLVQELKNINQKSTEELNICNNRLNSLQNSTESNKYLQEQTKAYLEEKCKNQNDLILNLIGFCFDTARVLSDNCILSASKKKELMNIKSKLLKHNYEVPNTKNLNLKQKTVKSKNTIKTEDVSQIKTENPFLVCVNKLDKSTQYVSSSITRAVNTEPKVTNSVGVNIPEINDWKSCFETKLKYTANNSDAPLYSLNKIQKAKKEKFGEETLNKIEKNHPIMTLWRELRNNIFTLIKKHDNSLSEYLDNHETILQEVFERQKGKEDVSKLFYLNNEFFVTSPTSDYSETQLSGDSADDIPRIKPEMSYKEFQFRKKTSNEFFSLLDKEITNQLEAENLKTVSATIPNNNNNLYEGTIELCSTSCKNSPENSGDFLVTIDESKIEKDIINNSNTKNNKDFVEFVPNTKRLVYTLSDSSDEGECIGDAIKNKKECKKRKICSEGSESYIPEMEQLYLSNDFDKFSDSKQTTLKGTKNLENPEILNPSLEKYDLNTVDNSNKNCKPIKKKDNSITCTQQFNNVNNLISPATISTSLDKIKEISTNNPSLPKYLEVDCNNKEVDNLHIQKKIKPRIPEPKSLGDPLLSFLPNERDSETSTSKLLIPSQDSGTSDSSSDSEESSSSESMTSNSSNDCDSDSSVSFPFENSISKSDIKSNFYTKNNKTELETYKQEKNILDSTIVPNKITSLFVDLFGDNLDKSPAHSPSLLLKEKNTKLSLCEKNGNICNLQDDLYLSSSDDSSCDDGREFTKTNSSQNKVSSPNTKKCNKTKVCIEENSLDEGKFVANNCEKIMPVFANIYLESDKLKSDFHKKEIEISERKTGFEMGKNASNNDHYEEIIKNDLPMLINVDINERDVIKSDKVENNLIKHNDSHITGKFKENLQQNLDLDRQKIELNIEKKNLDVGKNTFSKTNCKEIKISKREKNLDVNEKIFINTSEERSCEEMIKNSFPTSINANIYNENDKLNSDVVENDASKQNDLLFPKKFNENFPKNHSLYEKGIEISVKENSFKMEKSVSSDNYCEEIIENTLPLLINVDIREKDILKLDNELENILINQNNLHVPEKFKNNLHGKKIEIKIGEKCLDVEKNTSNNSNCKEIRTSKREKSVDINENSTIDSSCEKIIKNNFSISIDANICDECEKINSDDVEVNDAIQQNDLHFPEKFYENLAKDQDLHAEKIETNRKSLNAKTSTSRDTNCKEIEMSMVERSLDVERNTISNNNCEEIITNNVPIPVNANIFSTSDELKSDFKIPQKAENDLRKKHDLHQKELEINVAENVIYDEIVLNSFPTVVITNIGNESDGLKSIDKEESSSIKQEGVPEKIEKNLSEIYAADGFGGISLISKCENSKTDGSVLENNPTDFNILNFNLFENASFINKISNSIQNNTECLSLQKIQNENCHNIKNLEKGRTQDNGNNINNNKCSKEIGTSDKKIDSHISLTSNAVEEILKLFPRTKKTRRAKNTRQIEVKRGIFPKNSSKQTQEMEKVLQNSICSNKDLNTLAENFPITSTSQKSYMCLRSTKKESYKRKLFENFVKCSNKKLKVNHASTETKSTLTNKQKKDNITNLEEISTKNIKMNYQLPLQFENSKEQLVVYKTPTTKTNYNVRPVEVNNINVKETPNINVFSNIPNHKSLSPIKKYSLENENLSKSTEKLIEECLEDSDMSLKYFHICKENIEEDSKFQQNISTDIMDIGKLTLNKNISREPQKSGTDSQSYLLSFSLEESFLTNDSQSTIPLQLNAELSTSELNYSPASPKCKFDEAKKFSPKLVPLEREEVHNIKNKMAHKSSSTKKKSVIQYFLNIFDSHTQSKVLQNKIKIETKVLFKLRNILYNYIESPANADQVKKCIHRLLQNTQNTKLICQAITEVIKTSKDQNKVTSNLSLAISETEAKIIVLIDKFNTHIKQFKQNVVAEIHNIIFKLNQKSIPLENLINLIKFNIILMDLQDSNDENCEDDRKMARLLIFKCFYYYHIKAIPMVFQLLASYPSVLPRKNNPYYKNDDVIIKTIQCILNSTSYNISKIDLRHREMFFLLKDFYNYDRVKPSREELIEFLIENIRKHLLKNISYSFALICKQYGAEWTENFVIEKNILPLLNEYYSKILKSDENDDCVECLIESLSFILKAFPLDFNNFDKYFQIFTNFLHSTTRKRTQQAAVCALLRLARFGYDNIFTAILNWCPNFEVDKIVDIDKTILELNSHRINPLLCDYLKRRETPFKIEIYEGSIDNPNDILKNTDVIFAIELIEHLHPDVLENVPYNIFGFIQPKIAIFTTPNSEFNILFDLNLPNGMRHPDHKFEWTRSQFRDWCQNICKRFQNYVVSVFGVGNGPPIRKKIGKVSQMAVFIRKDMVNMEIPIDMKLAEIDLKEYEVISSTTKEYKLIHSVDYPFFKDDRTLDEKILDEAKYHINRCKNQNHYNKFINNTEKSVIPLDEIFYYTKQFSDSIHKLKDVLKINHYIIESNNIIMEVEEEFGRHGDDVDELLYGSDNTYYNDEKEKSFSETVNSDNKEDKCVCDPESISDNVSECWD